MNEKLCILIKISLKFGPTVPIDNNLALVVMGYVVPFDAAVVATAAADDDGDDNDDDVQYKWW